MKVYKIRNKDTGLFSTGGMRPKWTKQGKTWNKLNYVHSHINQLKSSYTPADVYSRAEVVEAEITEILKPVEDAADYLNKVYDEEIAHYENYAKKYTGGFYSEWAEKLKGRKAILNESK